MVQEKVTPKHIVEYANNQYDEEYQHIDDIPKRYLFEAVSETIVKLNPAYEMQQLAEEFADSDQSKKAFSEDRFDQVIHDDLREFLPLVHRDDWVEHTIQGLHELT